MNLLPKDKMDDKHIPAIFTGQEYIVNGKNEVKGGPRGENLRKGPSQSSEIDGFVPNGVKVVTQGKKKGKYFRVLKIGGVAVTKKVYIYSTSNEKEFTVKANEQEVLYKGQRLRNKDDNTIIGTLKNGTKISISGEDGIYYKVVKVAGEDKPGLIWKEGVGSKDCLALEDDKLDKVVSGQDCNMPIKAGTVIGFSAPSALNSDPNYKTAHIEVFTDQDPAKFITGKEDTNEHKGVPYRESVKESKDDTLNTKKNFKFIKGKKLSLKLPDVYKKGDKVKVISSSDEQYCKISLDKQVRVVSWNDLDHKGKYSGIDKYNPKHINNLQAEFTGLKSDSILDLIDKDIVDKDVDKARKVSYTLPDIYKTCWAKKSDLKIVNGQSEITMGADIALYSKVPKDGISEFEIVEDIVLSKSEIEDVVPVNENPTWCKVKVKDKEGKKEGYILDSDIEKISAHDWVAFGFKISKLYPNNFVLSSQDNYLKMIWKELGNEGDVNKEELTEDLTEQVMSRKLSKLICYHNSEWGADYSKLELEVSDYFDKIIAEADSNVKEDLETKKTAALEALKPKVEGLDFWSKVKLASNEPEGLPSFGDNFSSGAQTPSYMAWGEPQAEETTTIPFPTSPKVYHFHPIAFVEQMRMMENDGAPWMKGVLAQYKKYSGVRQTQSPLKEQIYKYFDSSSYPSGTNKTNWCAAFVNWCFEQVDEYKGTNPIANVAAYDWLPPIDAKKERSDVDGWASGEKITDINNAFVGAIIVFSHSHVAFVVGQSEDKKSLIYLGGNQSDGAVGDGKGKRTICTNPKLKSGFNKSFWLVKPKEYKLRPGDNDLPIINPNGEELNYSDTHN